MALYPDYMLGVTHSDITNDYVSHLAKCKTFLNVPRIRLMFSPLSFNLDLLSFPASTSFLPSTHHNAFLRSKTRPTASFHIAACAVSDESRTHWKESSLPHT